MDLLVLPRWPCAPDPELSVEMGIQPPAPSQAKPPLVDVQTGPEGKHGPLGGLVLFQQIDSPL